MFSSLVGAPSGPTEPLSPLIEGTPSVSRWTFQASRIRPQVMYPGVLCFVVLGGDHAALKLLEHHTALPCSRIAVTRQWLSKSLPLVLGRRRVLGGNRTGQRHLDVPAPR